MLCFPRGALRRQNLAAALLGGLVLAAQAPACTESRPGVDVRDEEGEQMCCELGALCHVAEQTEAGGEGGAAGAASEGPRTPKDCHDLGHEGEPDRCRTYYEACLTICEVEPDHADDIVEHACE